jgi:hypothetical protein
MLSLMTYSSGTIFMVDLPITGTVLQPGIPKKRRPKAIPEKRIGCFLIP